MTNQEMVQYLKNLAYYEREYFSDVLNNVENPHEIAYKLEEAANMLEEQEQKLKREYMRGYDNAWNEIR